MKKMLVRIGALCSLISCILFLNSCQKEELALSNNDDAVISVTTRALSGFLYTKRNPHQKHEMSKR